MKTIMNKLRFALLLGFIAIGTTVLAQQIANIEKMSVTTQMFLDEMAGRISFEEQAPPARITSPGMRPLPKPQRPIVDPDTINGIAYIAASVRITNENDLKALENLGVIIQCKFDKGLVTTMIPVDKIQDVAALEGITRVNVSSVMRPLTNLARTATNVDDVLTLSNDARNAGLLKAYDGSGVILGIIDDGIDFQHKAFTDKNGNTRIKGAYCYDGERVTADWTGSGTLPTTDDKYEDHGTHTSSIAGGSSVVISGTNVTVTDDHASATYGGMAPGTDLFLAGTQLATTYILNAFQKMSNYADAQGKPLVVSNSWGSSYYARDGYTDMSDVLAQYFGDDKPNHICLFASSNDAGMAEGGAGGGRYVTGSSSQASPIGTIIRSTPYLEDNGYQYYNGCLANAWTRANNASGIGINIYVINKNTGAISNTYNYTSSGGSKSVTLGGLNMTLYVYFDYVESNGKHQVYLRAPNNKSTSNYVIAIEVYPIGSSDPTIDIFGGDYTYLTNYVNTSGHTWVNGSDDLSMGDEGMDPSVISVGSYVTRNGTYSTGDISDFSSYAAEGVGPTGVMHPWICAPGEVIISAINHYVPSYYHGTVTVNNSTAPYGEMSGTSMATPVAAGIVALWLQAAQEEGIDLTLSEVKNIMKETAIRDSWVTSGPHASHFGNGKINALAGIEYILGNYEPITAGTVSPTELTFTDVPIGRPQSQTVTITNTGNQAFTPVIDTTGLPSEFTVTGSGEILPNSTLDLTVTYTPTSESSQNGSFTVTIGDQTYTVTVTGNGITVNSTLTSNAVEVPAYHSDLQANDAYVFSKEEVDADTDMNLEYNNDPDLSILVKSDALITGYNLMRAYNIEDDWTVAGTINHVSNSYVMSDTTIEFDNGETEMWFPLQDNNVDPTQWSTLYIPVTVANGVITQGNTYGAPIRQKLNDEVTLTVRIGGSKSDKRQGGHWNQNGVEYCIYTPVIVIESNDLDGVVRIPYMYRAWLLSDCAYDFDRGADNAIVGTTPLTSPHLLGEIVLNAGESGERVQIGTDWDINHPDVKLQNAFAAPCSNANLQIAVRAYYLPGGTQGYLRGSGGYAFGEGGSEGNFDLPTAVAEILGGKQVVDVTYVNSLGMTSSEPFDGINIVVTRYNDGSTTTVKMRK